MKQKIAELEAVQADLDRLQEDTGLPMFVIIILAVLGALLLILLAALLIMAFRSQRQPMYPPPYPYPPRRPKKRRRPQPVNKSEQAPPSTPVQPAQPVQQVAPPQVEEDPAVLQSEIGDIRKSIVSMSVGQPETTTRIVKEWMQEEAPVISTDFMDGMMALLLLEYVIGSAFRADLQQSLLFYQVCPIAPQRLRMHVRADFRVGPVGDSIVPEHKLQRLLLPGIQCQAFESGAN